MEIQRSTQDGCAILALTGSIDLASVSMVQRALLKEFSQQPYALICDLSGVDRLDRVCATVFATVANHPASRWPATGFALCAARAPVAEILDRLQLPDFVPIHADLDQALAAVFARPPYLREELVLAPTLSAPAAARAFVRDTCVDWQLAQPEEPWLDRAMLLANELVINAVLHAGTELWLRVELRGDRLHIAVHDESPRLLRVVGPDPRGNRGGGLWMVERLARTWGVQSHPDGGKVVWCALDLWSTTPGIPDPSAVAD
jgi:anti-anti-sigma factor